MMPRTAAKTPNDMLNSMLDRVEFASKVIDAARECGLIPKAPGRKPRAAATKRAARQPRAVTPQPEQE